MRAMVLRRRGAGALEAGEPPMPTAPPGKLRDFIMLAMPLLGREAPVEMRRTPVEGRGVARARGAELAGLARPVSLSLWTLPITALRVTPSPSSPAIWLALRPSIQSFFKVSTRSSVQPADCAPETIVKTESFIALPKCHGSHHTRL